MLWRSIATAAHGDREISLPGVTILITATVDITAWVSLASVVGCLT